MPEHSREGSQVAELVRTSRALRVVVRPRTDTDATEVLAAKTRGHRSRLLSFVAPSSGLDQPVLASIGKAAHQWLPMVTSRLVSMGASHGREFLRVVQSTSGIWCVSVAGVRVRKALRTRQVKPEPVEIKDLHNHDAVSLAVEVACRRARLDLSEMDESLEESTRTRFSDELIESEVRLLRAHGCS